MSMIFLPFIPDSWLPDFNYDAINGLIGFYGTNGQFLFNLLSFCAISALIIAVSRNRGTKMQKTPAVKARDVEDWIIEKIEDKVYREHMDTKQSGEWYAELSRLLDLPGLVNNAQRRHKKQIKARLKRKDKNGETLYRTADGERKVLPFPDRAREIARNALDAIRINRKAQG